MKKMNKQGWYSLFIEIICWAYFLLFVYAAFSKLFELDKFRVTMGKSAMLNPYAGVLAWVVPFVEIVLGLMVVFPLGRWRLLGLYGSFSLMSMFTTYIVIVLYFLPDVICACGAAIEALGWFWHLVLNVAFLVLGVIGIVLVCKLQNSLFKEGNFAPYQHSRTTTRRSGV